MNLGVGFLCFLVCIATIGCDRVYVHPFYLFSMNNTKSHSCKELEVREQLMKTFIPISIESHLASESEESLRNRSEEEKNRLGVKFLRDPIHTVGARFYQKLREICKEDNIFLSPIYIYESLLAFYLGASGTTANNLQTLLEFSSPSIDPNCTFKIDGRKVLTALRFIINSPFHSKDTEGLLFSKLSCLFSAPDIRLSESFVHQLAFSDVNFYVRAVDFTNPAQAAKYIGAFVEDKTTPRSKSLLVDIEPETTLLLATFTQFRVIIKGASLLKKPQDFWLNSDTAVPVPMMRVTGNFEYKCDGDPNLIVVKIPVSKSIFLLLLQPTNSSDLGKVEKQYSLTPSVSWMQKLSARQIQLTLPKVSLKTIYNLQELLVKQKMADLLGKNATFRLLSNANLTIGKVINQQHLELSPSGADEAEAPPEENEATETLKVTIDKPFLLAVYEKDSDVLIYFGRVTNPLKAT
ncbi:angiotensinogen [Sceloporus undulatus]|uniref:angiotensinogen n=1 Tax=Sceloporus undulatus TaxID=8520 RepID=UPI001C4AA4AD|nr:angiotensinogen [Sceloporus undulatus]